MSARKGSPRAPRRTGIDTRTAADGTESFRGTAFDKSTGKKLRGPWTTSPTEAKAWRVDAMARIQAGTLSGNRGRPLGAAASAFVAGTRSGAVLTRAGSTYKPAAVRGIETSFRLRIVPTLGANTRLGDLRRHDLQRAVDRWRAECKSASTVHNTLNALRALLRHAERRGEIASNPCTNLDLPRVEGKRDRVVSPKEAGRVLQHLEGRHRAILATVFFAGLRLGEMRALRWRDLLPRAIDVNRSWDVLEGPVSPKSDAGRRSVPIATPLSPILAAHRIACPWSANPEGLVFGDNPEQPFRPQRARFAVKQACESASVDFLNFHEGRHTAASWFIAAGVNLKAISTYMGHASITITLDRYGHLLPNSDNTTIDLLDEFFEREAASF